MSNRWLDRPFWKRGLLYHLYLVALKDNFYRAKRGARWLRVMTRVVYRWARNWFTGRRYTLRTYVSLAPVQKAMAKRWVDAMTFLAQRENTMAAMLTGLNVALLTHSVPPFTGWEWYKQAARTRSYAPKKGPYRVVGKPVVYSFRDTKVGVTEWADDFVPRADQLAARKRLKAMARV